MSSQRVAGVATVEELRALDAIRDPLLRARRLGQAITELSELRDELAAQRRRAVLQLRDDGHTMREIAGLLQVSRPRVHQMISSATPR